MTEVPSPAKPASPLRRLATLWLGIALVPIGVVIMPLPGPFGVPIIAVGAILIISSSRRAASWVRLHRRRWIWLHELLEKGEGWIAGEFGDALRRTNGRKRPPQEPVALHWRILDFLLFPVHVVLIVWRVLVRRYTRPRGDGID
jgi:hypothetical protein